MASNKDNDSSASGGGDGGPGPSPSPSPSPSSKLADTTKALNLSGPFDDDVDEQQKMCTAWFKGLNLLAQGPCSTCASDDHDTVYCDRKDEAQVEYMMSGALQSDVEDSSSAAAQGTAATGTSTAAAAAQAVKIAEAEGAALPRQRIGRRHSV